MENTLILKEDISRFHIVSAEVDKKEHWKQELGYAVRLGNAFKGKTSITFTTTDGLKTVQTTVWSLTEDYILLKGGVTIPLNSIVDVHF